MKKLIFAFLLLLSITSFQTIEAKGVIVYHNGPTFSTLHELPSDMDIDGTHVNFGVSYEQFGIFWLPLWNYGEVEYAFVSDDGNKAWSLDAEDVAKLKETHNFDIADEPSVPIMSQIGLKPIALLLLIAIIWSNIPRKKEEEVVEESGSEE